MRISIWYDVACPWCYIGHQRLFSALADVPSDKLDIDFRPFQLAPDLPREFDRDEYYRLKSMDPAVMKAGQGRIREIGKSVGIDFHHEKMGPMFNTRDAHRLMAWAPREKKKVLLDALFKGNFTDGRNYGRTADLAAVAEAAGLGSAATVTKFLESPELVDAIASQVKEAYAMPIITVPYMVVNDRFPVQFVHMEGVAQFAVDNLRDG